ncbi:glycoside hydrolase family 13 protein [Mesoplasma seiffertii]|uniref:glycoside hydrolase family 13 protein n=1 Tax=Mesoplasma seiffertii TaxID=28224 RepID=UPI000479CB2D|nr:glycoside hydrolase family 13 protein [Mesoplasma seiffertii]
MNKIEKSAIIHIPKSNMAYAYDEEKIHIILRTKKDDLVKVELWCTDPFDVTKKENLLNFKAFDMKKTGSTTEYDYWFIEIKPKDKRLTYFFNLYGQCQDNILFTEKGFFDIDILPKILQGGFGFTFPWMNPVDIFEAPRWIKDTIWYQIFPERFANGDQAINPPETLDWGSTEPTPDNFFGGDLQGIINNLDHLADLGVNGLYLCPIFKASTNHKYDTVDYFEIDPNFGNKDKFRELVDKCHSYGIKIMIDGVFNHIGYKSPIWQDVVKNQENSKYKNWFFVKEFPVEAMDETSHQNNVKELNYHTFSYNGYMPKFNTSNKEARDYLLEVGRYWVEEFGVDAWRLDVANEVDHKFWRSFRNKVKMNNSTYILGEIWTEANAWLKGDQFDGVMNYFLTSAISDFIAQNSISAETFKDRITNVLHIYPKNVLPGMFNCLDSHDTPRLLTQCGDRIEKFLLAYSFLFTCVGAPSIYYGDEIGMNGDNDPGCRKCMNWNKSEWNQQIFAHFKNLCNLRKTHPILGSYGEMKFNFVSDHYIEYSKFDEQNRYVIFLNNSENSLILTKPNLKGKTELITNQLEQKDEIVLASNSLRIYKIQ